MIRKKIKSQRNLLKAYNMLLYFAGTMIIWDPENECIHDFWKEGILSALPLKSSNPRFMKAASQLRESIEDHNSGLEYMKDDFHALFKGATTLLAPPTETDFNNKYSLVSTGKNSPVGDFYESYGWNSSLRETIPDDHIGVELLFLTLMVEKYLEIDDEACHVEMKSEIRRYIDNHLMNWVPFWFERIQENASTLSYKGIGTLILACIEDLYGIMDDSDCRVVEKLKN
jgi:TorA maturation chaperone TorD